MAKHQTGGVWGNTNPTAINPLTNLQTELQQDDEKWLAELSQKQQSGEFDSSEVLYDTQHTREGLADLSHYTDPIEKYTEYGVPLGRRSDWNEERANNQTTGEKWRRGLTKAAITTVGAVAENTFGVLAGLGEVLTGGQYYDNAVGRSIDNMNEWAREEMPNYYTEAEQNNESALASMGTANFWADKAANGLGYSIGSIATMAMTGGAGYMGMAAKAMNMKRSIDLAEKASKIHKLYKVSKTAARGEKLSKMMGQVSQAQRFKNGGQMIDGAIMMSLAEGSVEARETKNHVYETLVNQELGRLNLNHASQIPQEKLDQIQKDANAAGNANFGMNMGILSVSNAFMFGKMLGPKHVAGRVPIEGLKKEGVNKVIDTTTKGWRKAFKKAKPFLGGMATEATQEGSQYASNIASTEFAISKYSDQGGITRMQALSEGLSRTFGETEGREAILLGAITGGIMSGGGSLISRPAKKRDERANDILNILNSGALDNTIDRGRNQERSLYYIKKMEEAREQGNEELFEQYRTQAIISDAITLEEAGQIDLYYEKLDDTLSFSDEDFAKEFGHDPDAKIDKHKVVDDLKKDIALAVKRKNAVDAMFPITQTRGAARLFMSEEERNEEKQKNTETLMLRDHLLQNAVFLDKVSDRKKTIAAELSKTMPGVTLNVLEQAADQAKERYDSIIEEAILATEGVTSEAGLPQEVRDAASQEARLMYMRRVMEQLPENYKGNPVDNQSIGQNLSTYYGLHSNEQDMFENWNRLQTSQGRDEWIRVALMDQEEQATNDADLSVEDMIQQETDPEKLAANTPPNASRSQKRKIKKEAKNINNIKKNIIDQYGKDSVSMEELEAAIEDRLPVEALAGKFESSEEKQAYIELQTLRALRIQRKENIEGEEKKKQAEENEQRANEVAYTALLVNDPEKLRKVFKPAHPNEYYTHMVKEENPESLDDKLIGKKKKLKIIGRYKSDKIDVILVEGSSMYTTPHIILSLADNVSEKEVAQLLGTAVNESGPLHPDSMSPKAPGLIIYKSPKYVQVTEGYVDGNNNEHTTTLEESTPQETIDSPAKVDEQGQTEMVFEEKPRYSDDRVPVKREEFTVYNEDGTVHGVFRATTHLDGSVEWKMKAGDMWTTTTIIDSKYQKENNISNEEAIKAYTEIKDRDTKTDKLVPSGMAYKVGEVVDYKGVMNPKMFDRLTTDQQNRIDPARMSEGFVEEEVGQTQEFTDDSEFVIFDDEFIDPEVLAQELAAQNAEAAAMSGQEVQELGSIPMQEAPAPGNELPSHLVKKVNNALQMEEFGNIYNNLVDQNLSKEAATKPSYIKVMEGESLDGFTQIVIFTDSDVIGYAEVDLKQNIMGGIKLVKNARRLGIATKIYEHLISKNILLESSHAQRPGGKALWQSLVKKGLATKISEDTYGPTYQLVKKTEPAEKTLAAPVATTIAKEGTSDVFKNNSKLSEIGTEEQYSAYLDTVFPSSKVDGIQYHGTQREFEEFKLGVSKVSPGTTATDLFWFTNRESAGMYAGEQVDWSKFTAEEIAEGKKAMLEKGMTTSRVIPSVLDSKNPFDYENPEHLKIIEEIIKSREDYIPGDVETFTEAIKKEGNWFRLEKLTEEIKKAGFDGVFALERDDNGNLSKDLAVFSPSQIQILGSKQDIKGFKEFVSKPGADSRQFELSALEAEERALLKEEAELRNSLNKEDENCAT